MKHRQLVAYRRAESTGLPTRASKRRQSSRRARETSGDLEGVTTTVPRGRPNHNSSRNRAAATATTTDENAQASETADTPATTSTDAQQEPETSSQNANGATSTAQTIASPIVASANGAPPSVSTLPSTVRALSQSSAQASSSSSRVTAAASNESSNMATPANLARTIPAVIGSIVAAVLIIVFFVCFRRRIKTRQKTAKAPLSPLIGGAAPFGHGYGTAEKEYNPYAEQAYAVDSDTPASTWRGRPKSFLDSVKYKLDSGSDMAVAYGGVSNVGYGNQDPQTAAMMNRDLASSPTYSNQLQMSQAHAVDPFRAGFGPGAGELSAGLAGSLSSDKEGHGRRSMHGPNASVSTTRSGGQRQSSVIQFGTATDDALARFSNAEEQPYQDLQRVSHQSQYNPAHQWR